MEELLNNGAPELLTETAEGASLHFTPCLVGDTLQGRYFDLVQRLSLLEKFECTNDMRVWASGGLRKKEEKAF